MKHLRILRMKSIRGKKSSWRVKSSWLALCILAGAAAAAGLYAAADLSAAPQAQPAAAGELQFQALVIPSGGQAEPVRQLPFYLLRKSLLDIRKEAEQAEPVPDLNRFIDGLDASAELKAWIKKTRIIDFTGKDFTRALKADDILRIPEFFEAYKNLNGAILNITIPSSQVKESDRLKNPDKYQREKDKYMKELEQYVHAHPESIDGLDAEVSEVNPGRRWAQLQSEQQRHAQQRVLLLAQTEYLSATAVSDLNGGGTFRDLPAGSYWITALGTPALAGDVRLEWDVPVTVRPGQTARVQLSNFNALPPSDVLR